MKSSQVVGMGSDKNSLILKFQVKFYNVSLELREIPV